MRRKNPAMLAACAMLGLSMIFALGSFAAYPISAADHASLAAAFAQRRSDDGGRSHSLGREVEGHGGKACRGAGRAQRDT